MIRKLLAATVLAATAVLSGVSFSTQAGAEEGLDPALADKIRATRDIAREFLGSPNGIPREILKDAKAVVIISNAIRAGFIFAGYHGRGVAVARTESGEWSAPAFYRITGISAGFQAGGEVSDVILVVKSQKVLDALLIHHVTMGIDFDATAGPWGRDAKALVNVAQAEVISYGRTHGLFAGFSFEGVSIHEDREADARYYGKPLSARDILLGGAAPSTPPAAELAEALRTGLGG